MTTVLLGKLKKGQTARIVSVRAKALNHDAADASEDYTQRLLEMGLLEGSLVEVMHEAPFGGDPIAVRVRGALIALRRAEANCIEVTYE